MNYKEVRFAGTREFVLGDHELRIQGKNFMGHRFAVTVPFDQLRKSCNTVWTRSKYFNLGFSSVSTGLILSIGATLHNADNLNLICFLVVAFCVPGLGYMACTFRRVEFKQFLYNSGTVAFDIARSGPMKADFDAVVTAILDRVPGGVP